MMRFTLSIVTLIIGLVLVGAVGWQVSMAQEEEYNLAHEDVFGNLRRPQVFFSHEIHVDNLEDGGCGKCHHSPDDDTGQLVYIDGDEQPCAECHGLQKEDRILALREAYHTNCTGCHRDLIKSGNLQSGPTTCGECHRKN